MANTADTPAPASRRRRPQSSGEPLLRSVTLRGLKWGVVLAALAFLAVLEYSRLVLAPVLGSWGGRLLLYGVVVVCIVFFSAAVFAIIEDSQAQVAKRNRELLALHEAALDITAELSLESVLQTVVDHARALLDARFGALSVYQESDRIHQFITSGITPEERLRIGDPPAGRGLLGVVLKEGQRLRLAHLAEHPESCGFPAGHPPMATLLAVPIVCSSPFRGNLYLAEKGSGETFSDDDEEALVRFATQAAIAIDNAFLHEQVRDLAAAEERLRIAHEMHDGLAQVLAYVNTKAQAVSEFLRAGETQKADAQLAQLAAAAREVYTDVREAILSLRATADPERDLAGTLRHYVTTWQDHTGVAVDLLCEPLEVEPAIELQLVRIVQEALANVRKHAGAGRVEIRLERAGGGLRLAVADDGAGFRPDAPGGRREFPRFGLATMRERAESVGGRMRIDSAPGQGTTITVELPPLQGGALVRNATDAPVDR